MNSKTDKWSYILKEAFSYVEKVSQYLNMFIVSHVNFQGSVTCIWFIYTSETPGLSYPNRNQ